jgi:hypothetical protein
MATPAERAAAIQAEANRVRNLERAQAQQAQARVALETAQIGARGTTGQTIFEKALAGLPSSYDKSSDVAKGMAAMSARYGLQGATLNAYTGANVGYNISEQTKAEQQALDIASSLVSQYSTPINIPTVTEESKESTTGNLSLDAFINTLTLLMGKEEASKPYVKELYSIVSKFYKQGSTISDSINLALYQAKEQKAIPEFTNRFSGIFALQERRAKGEAIDVPTIAEYIKSQQRLGEILRRSALGDLANETFLNTVMATGKSVDESTQIITDVFDLIDNAPEVFKKELSNRFPTVTRAQLATALLTGPQGIKQLESTVKRAGVVAAGTAQGLKISEALAEDLASKGQSFASAGTGFLRTAQILPVAQKLTSIETGIEPEKAYTVEQAVAATFDQSAAELQRLADLAERERARLSGSAGTAGSRSLASKNRGLGLI